MKNEKFTLFKKYFEYSIPVLIGFILFLLTIGIRVLSPSNIGWIFKGPNSDGLQAYLGWKFFQNSPWGFPLGSNPGYGLDPKNSIAYSDSIPLLALFCKIFTRNLVGDFQYFGIWLMLCFVLQSLLTYKILRLFQQDRLCLYLGTISISLVPFWLEKTSIHFSLSGHFLILSAIYLVLNDREPSKFEGFKWRVLLFAALGIHAYIFAMILPFYLVSIANKFSIIRKISRSIVISFITTLVSLLLASVFVYGYNVGSPEGISENYWGVYRFNWLAPVNPNGWSYILNLLSLGVTTNSEMSTYLGFGLIILLTIVGIFTVSNSTKLKDSDYIIQKRFPILIALSILFMFATTNHLSIGNFQYIVGIPKRAVEIFSIFRASVRFIWPVLYWAIFLAYERLSKYLFGKRNFAILLFICVCQIIDVLPHAYNVSARFDGPTEQSRLSNQWKTISERYHEIRVPRSGDQDNVDGWPAIAIISSKLRMRTNAAYLARSDDDFFSSLNKQTMYELSSGKFAQGVAYALFTEKEKKLAEKSKSNQDSIVTIDEVTLLLPSWYP